MHINQNSVDIFLTLIFFLSRFLLVAVQVFLTLIYALYINLLEIEEFGE